MEEVSFNSLMPKEVHVKKIHSGSELLLAYELDKYLKKLAGKELSMKGISVAKELLSSMHYSFVVANGLNIGQQQEIQDLASYSKQLKYFFTGTVESVVFQEETADIISYNYNKDVIANSVLHGENRSASYVSLVAYLMVLAYINNEPYKKLFIDHSKYNERDREYVDLVILQLHGNKILKDLVEIDYNKNSKYEPTWEAMVVFNRQLGRMAREYSISEKYKYLSKNFEVGDVVLLYRTKGDASGKEISKLASCYPAVINSFDNQQIMLNYYPNVVTQLTNTMELNKIVQGLDEEEKDIFTPEDYSMFTESKEFYHLVSFGIDKCTYLEETFILKPLDVFADTDGSIQHLKSAGLEGQSFAPNQLRLEPSESDSSMYDAIRDAKSGMKTERCWMSTTDTIYAVFEDRGVQYNKEKFLETYFYSKGIVPVYDEYLNALEEKGMLE